MPSARKPDQTPRPASPTGVTDGQVPDLDPRAQSGAFLTTAEGLRLPDTDHSLKAGAPGPTLLEDFHLREKITEFDALVVASGTTPTADIKLVVLLQEAFRHCKAVAAWGDGTAVLKAARIPAKGPGIVMADDVDPAI
jgi:hypothetical protein